MATLGLAAVALFAHPYWVDGDATGHLVLIWLPPALVLAFHGVTLGLLASKPGPRPAR